MSSRKRSGHEEEKAGRKASWSKGRGAPADADGRGRGAPADVGRGRGAPPSSQPRVVATPDPRDPDVVIRGLAVRQHGVVSRAQLVAAGVPLHRIEYRVKRGTLAALYPGVYRVGPVSGRFEQEAAALLACAPHGALSHRTAAGLWIVLPRDPGAPVDVTVPGGWLRPGPGVRVHRSRSLRPDELREVAGLAVTAPARTLLDLASSLDPRTLERCLAKADREGLAGADDMRAMLARHPGHPGARVLRSLIAGVETPAFTRSEAEQHFLALVRRARLPRPRTNARVRGIEVDAWWPAANLVVEVDGRAFHSSPRAFERDRRRDAALTAAGLRVMRVTWRQLVDEPEVVLVHLAQALGR